MDLLITGANGFVGSQIATQWLARRHGSRILCLARGESAEAARTRLLDSLTCAIHDQALELDPGALAARVVTIHGDVTDGTWIDSARNSLIGPTEICHCAANLSFREADRSSVWRTNVDGTAALLAALPDLAAITAFNHVSTAYVAGDRQGTILEDDRTRPASFNNPYEESKWVAEGLVQEACIASGVSWRVFRPSIIIAHSVTHRMSSQSGFYQVADTLMQFGRDKRATGLSRILLPVATGTTLDLIPVDMVVNEIMALVALGAASCGRTFHITSDAPLSLDEVLSELSPMSGVSIGVGREGDEVPSVIAELLMRRLRYYMPYFAFVRSFDRRNAAMGGEATAFSLDVNGLRGFVRSFMSQQDRTG